MIRQLFIQTKPTPNPSSLKFVPGKDVMPAGDQTMDFSSIRFTHISPLARKLFQIEGIVRVFYGKDFISVTKKDDLDWNIVKPEVLEAITDHYSKNQPLFIEDLPAEDTQINDDDTECVAMIKEIIETRIRPFVQEDGGDVKYLSFDEEKGHVKLQMKGSCAGCPSSAVTLKNGIENMLKHYVAEVETVEAVDDVPE